MRTLIEQIVDDVREDGPRVISRDGEPAAVIVDYDELVALRERIAELDASERGVEEKTDGLG